MEGVGTGEGGGTDLPKSWIAETNESDCLVNTSTYALWGHYKQKDKQ